MTNILGPAGALAFQNRQIDPQVAVLSGAYTGICRRLRAIDL
ncbi:hypothetical protein [Rhizobium ruizarguesonis]|nr:hypothetical protein [Rhizobium ruizarguesonis]